MGVGNIKLMGFERDIMPWLDKRGWDSLGTFNLTVQSLSEDGTHATMEANLVKAMMVSSLPEDHADVANDTAGLQLARLGGSGKSEELGTAMSRKFPSLPMI